MRMSSATVRGVERLKTPSWQLPDKGWVLSERGGEWGEERRNENELRGKRGGGGGGRRRRRSGVDYLEVSRIQEYVAAGWLRVTKVQLHSVL